MQSLADTLFGVFSSSAASSPRSPQTSRRSTRSRRSSGARSSSSGRTIINVELKPGGLSDWGYDSNDSTRTRHRALMRAAREEGYRPIIGRLNLIYVYNRYRSPHYARIFKEDQKWLSRKYEEAKDRGEVPRSRRSRSSRRR